MKSPHFFLKCIGTMNRSESPSPGLRPPSPPPKAGERAGRGGGSTRQRLGVRGCSAAFDEREDLEFVWFMESPLSLLRMHWDHEPPADETAPPRCCRHLAGNAFLRLVCRQDAGSTL